MALGFGSEKKLMARVGADISDFKAKMNELSVKAESTGARAAAALSRIGKMAPLAIVAGIGAIIKVYSDFERELANVSTLVDTNKVSMERLKKEIMALPRNLGSATEQTKALYQALSAGIKTAEGVAFVGKAALFAKAGLTSTTIAVDVLTTILNAYEMEASEAARISDILFTTIKYG